MDTSQTLSGAWELVSGYYIGEDKVVIDYARAELHSLKVLSADRFSFVTTAEGKFYAAAAGEYSAAHGTYAEMPGLASHPEMIGKRYEFQYLLEGDTWTNSRWQDGVCVEHEVWKRIR